VKTINYPFSLNNFFVKALKIIKILQFFSFRGFVNSDHHFWSIFNHFSLLSNTFNNVVKEEEERRGELKIKRAYA